MRFSVSVPVLSVQITVVAPSVSTAAKRSTTTSRRAMRHMPRASAMVATIGKPSGMAATARAMAASIMSMRSRPPAMPAAAIRAVTMRIAPTSWRVSPASLRSSGEVSPSASMTSRVVSPSSVAMPVATTTPSPVPRVMAVPLCSIEVRSATMASSGTAATLFSTGTDSPVRVNSSQDRFLASTRRISAVTTSPLSSRAMSPGTTSSAGTVFSFPSRRTREERVPSLRSASIERTARSSVKKPISVLTRSTSRMAADSVHSENDAAKAAAPARSQTTGLLIWPARSPSSVRVSWARSAFGP